MLTQSLTSHHCSSVTLRRILLTVATLAATALGTYYFWPTETQIPGEVKGVESFSFAMQSRDSVPSALGQVFKAPPKHPVLLNVSFLFLSHPRQRPQGEMPKEGLSASPSSSLPMKIKLRISPWDGSKIDGAPVFESEVLELPRFESTPKFNWVAFPIREKLRLKPGGAYVAWVTGIDLRNDGSDSTAIVRMGARGGPGGTWISLYPDGYMVSWDRESPDGSLARLQREPWKLEDRRASLHFKMNFRSR